MLDDLRQRRSRPSGHHAKPVAKARCHCGAVRFEATGKPIASVICYCDDCQLAGRRIEAFPNARPVLDSQGGSHYLVYRRDGVRCVSGSERISRLTLRSESATQRLVAECCSAPLLVCFTDSKHWIDLFSAQVVGQSAKVEFRMCTAFSPDRVAIPRDAKVSSGYPVRFIARLLAARLS